MCGWVSTTIRKQLLSKWGFAGIQNLLYNDTRNPAAESKLQESESWDTQTEQGSGSSPEDQIKNTTGEQKSAARSSDAFRVTGRKQSTLEENL